MCRSGAFFIVVFFALIDQCVDEVVFGADGVAARVEQHRAARLDIPARAACDGKDGIGSVVVVWSLDGDVAVGEEDRPEAFPLGLAGRHGARALPVVVPDYVLILRIINGVVEAEDITNRILARMKFLPGVGDSVFHNVNSRCAIRAGCRAAAQIHHEHTYKDANQERESGAEEQSFLHEGSPFEQIRPVDWPEPAKPACS